MTATNTYKSKLENQFAINHPGLTYESAKLPYVTEHQYTPDFQITENSYIETKGWFSPIDRAKILAVISQNPNVRVAMVFQNHKLKISKKSKTTYSAWCEKHNITWFSSSDILGIAKYIEKEIDNDQRP